MDANNTLHTLAHSPRVRSPDSNFVVCYMLRILEFFASCALLQWGAFAEAPSTLQVQLTSGTFQGLSVPNGTERWLGIPFAQSPVGPLRFKAPVAITKPAPGIQAAASFGDACPQIPDPTLGVGQSEDCLTLNVRFSLHHRRLIDAQSKSQVWRPPNTKATAKLPVLVWFYVSAPCIARKSLCD